MEYPGHWGVKKPSLEFSKISAHKNCEDTDLGAPFTETNKILSPTPAPASGGTIAVNCLARVVIWADVTHSTLNFDSDSFDQL